MTTTTRRSRPGLDLSDLIYAAGVLAASVTERLVCAVKYRVEAFRHRRLLREVREYRALARARMVQGPVTEFDHAREWAKENSPAFYRGWAVRYGWADTVEEDRQDEQDLIRHWRINAFVGP
ncbi:hypothetical protein ABH924_003737 [Arthrobacter sp. GAS37]|uniref:hypothetical protein n=1 Tax=Arthrobacter sp. GAS37 TaxID=3156261 RepID=UPI00383985DE